MRRLVLRAAAAAALLAPAPLLAQAVPPVVVGQLFLTPGLDPAEGNAGWALTSHGVTETLFTVDRAGQVVPNLAASAEKQPDGAWRVRLAPGRRFSDGAPVDAAAVAAGLARSVEKNPAARGTAGRLAFEVLDALTLKVATERPTPVLASVLAEWPFAVYRPGGDLVATGAYRPTAFRPGGRLDLAPNPHHPAGPDRPGATILRFGDGGALALALRSGEVDLAFNLPVESLAALRADPGLAVKSFPVAYQYMVWANARRPALVDARVRRALALAVERADLVRAVRAGRPSASLWAADYPFGDRAAPAADRAEARRLLDEAGWRPGPDGVRTKDGARLALALWAYPQRADLVTMQPVLRAALGEIGVAVETRVAENAQALARDGQFDLLLWAQHTAPAGDPAFFPSLFLASGAPGNYAGWSNATLDGLVRELANADAPERRAALARAIDARVREEAPVTMLMTPEWHVGLSRRVAGYEPWGSDYFVVRADLGSR